MVGGQAQRSAAERSTRHDTLPQHITPHHKTPMLGEIFLTERGWGLCQVSQRGRLPASSRRLRAESPARAARSRFRSRRRS